MTCTYICMATWSFYQGHSAKNDLSMEGLCDFCTRETFLQSVPGPCNWEQIAGHYDLWVITTQKTIQKYFLGGATCQDCRFPLQMVPHLFALLQVSTRKIAKLWVTIFICPTMHFSNSQTILSQTILSQSNWKCLKLFCMLALQNDLYIHMYVNFELLPGLPRNRSKLWVIMTCGSL
jgi:hypothetical protein